MSTAAAVINLRPGAARITGDGDIGPTLNVTSALRAGLTLADFVGPKALRIVRKSLDAVRVPLRVRNVMFDMARRVYVVHVDLLRDATPRALTQDGDIFLRSPPLRAWNETTCTAAANNCWELHLALLRPPPPW
jgi:hypothetical protein